MSENNSNASQENVLLKINSDFRPALIKEILKINFVNPKTKISDDAADLMNKIAKIMVIETSMRAAKQAKAENKSLITLDHVEIILPQIMLDFP